MGLAGEAGGGAEGIAGGVVAASSLGDGFPPVWVCLPSFAQAGWGVSDDGDFIFGGGDCGGSELSAALALGDRSLDGASSASVWEFVCGASEDRKSAGRGE